jgi:hypothetical protein
VTKSKIVKRPCTTYKAVYKTIVEKVPYTVCVPVCPAPPVCTTCY